MTGPASASARWPTGARGHRSAVRRAAAAVACALALLVSGCVSIPASGPVTEGDGAVDEPGTVFCQECDVAGSSSSGRYHQCAGSFAAPAR